MTSRMAYHGMLVEEFGPLDITNLVFLSAFCLSVFVRLCRNHTVFGIDRKEWPSLLVSLCCVFTGAAYFGAGLFNLIAITGETSKNHIWLFLVARGVIWILLASSLIVQQSNWIIILSLVWWVCFFLLVSGLSLQKTFTTYEVHIMLEWPLGFFLFICAVVKARQMFRQRSSDEDSLSEPLLVFKTEKQRPNNPGQASFLSSLTFSWMDSLLSVGYSKPLTLDDIPNLSPEDEASLAYQKFIKKWESLTRGSNNASNRNLVLEAIAKVFFRETVLVGACALLKTITCVCSPVLLFAFVNYSKRGNGSAKEGLVLVGILVVVKLVESLSQRHWFFNSRRSGMRMRSALMIAVYQKQLRLSSSGHSRHSTGEVVNYIAVDAYRMGEFPWWFHSLWSFTLQLLLSIGVLLGIVGMGALLCGSV